MTLNDPPDGSHDKKSTVADWIVPAVGILLVLLAVVLPFLFSFRLDIVIIAVALLGVGCTTIGFGIVNSGMLRSGTRIHEIAIKQEKVRKLINQTKK